MLRLLEEDLGGHPIGCFLGLFSSTHIRAGLNSPQYRAVTTVHSVALGKWVVMGGEGNDIRCPRGRPVLS